MYKVARRENKPKREVILINKSRIKKLSDPSIFLMWTYLKRVLRAEILRPISLLCKFSWCLKLFHECTRVQSSSLLSVLQCTLVCLNVLVIQFIAGAFAIVNRYATTCDDMWRHIRAYETCCFFDTIGPKQKQRPLSSQKCYRYIFRIYRRLRLHIFASFRNLRYIFSYTCCNDRHFAAAFMMLLEFHYIFLFVVSKFFFNASSLSSYSFSSKEWSKRYHLICDTFSSNNVLNPFR